MNNQVTIVRQIWSRVFNTPDMPAVLIPNPSKEIKTVVIPATIGSMPGVATLEPEPLAAISWGERGKCIASIMEYLSAQGFKKGDRAAVLSQNFKEIVWFERAVWTLGGVSVFIYPNTSPEGVRYILNDCKPSVLLVQNEAQLKKEEGVDIPKIMLQSPKGGSPLSSVMPWDTLLQSHDGTATLAALKKEFDLGPSHDLAGVKPSDDALIIYSSGTTGNPKGVVTTHDAIAAECVAIREHGIELSENDVYLSYLPLAHVLERVNGQASCDWYGTPSAYCTVDELGDALKLYHPTILFGVPMVWRRMMDKIEAQLKKATGLKAKLIKWAFKTKPGSFMHKIADMLVFKKIREGLGGRLRICLTGGAAITVDTLLFYLQIGVPLLQGYGLTETCGGLSVCTPVHNLIGSIGRPINCVDVRIVPAPGADDNGSGEIQVRGRTIFSRYYNLPEKTAECFVDSADSATRGRWFKTNDKGKIVNGYLFIEGRMDEVFKLESGKFVRGSLVTKAVGQSDLIQTAFPVGPGRKFTTGLIFIKEAGACDLLAANGIKVEKGQTAFGVYKTNPQAQAIIDKVIKEAIAASVTWHDESNPDLKIEEEERIKKFAVVPEATLENGLLNETLKLKIKEVPKVHKDVIEELYIIK